MLYALAVFFICKCMEFFINDKLRLKKKHPCGGEEFIVMRLGSDIKLRCSSCSREIMLPRIKLEKMIRAVYAEQTETD